jgi:H+/Cl- antiporter ClcA
VFVGSKFNKISNNFFVKYLVKWLTLSLLVGCITGSASAIFLHFLHWAENVRESDLRIVWFLPISGLVIGLLYWKWGREVVKGNNQIIEEYYKPKNKIPLIMAPLVFAGTILTHLFGGSAGREGTAVQMGGAIADQFTSVFNLGKEDRKIILIIGVSAGFASVFGTPLAGAIFALEVLVLSKYRWNAFIPSAMTALIADFICDLWGVNHTDYSELINVNVVPSMSTPNFFWSLFVGLICGITAMLFTHTTRFWGMLFKKIKFSPLRPFVGGIVIALTVYFMGPILAPKYIGLGIPIIVDAFTETLNSYDFAIKIIFTAFTLGAGFKGGEVTPLFFIGATLGNALVWFVPLPMALLAGMGFVAVFSGATNTPIACTVMGMELFGIQGGLYIALACFSAYLSSGYTGIYSSQFVSAQKYWLYPRKVFNKNK